MIVSNKNNETSGPEVQSGGSLSNLVSNLPNFVGNHRDTSNPGVLSTPRTTSNVTHAQVHADGSGSNTTSSPETEQSNRGIEASSVPVVNNKVFWDDNLFEAWNVVSFTRNEPSASSQPLPGNQEAFRAESGSNHTTNNVVVLRDDEEPLYTALCERCHSQWGSDQDWGLGNASVRAVREVTPSEERETDDELVMAQRQDKILKVVAQLRLKGEEGCVEAQNCAEVKGFLPVWGQLGFERARLVRYPPSNTDAASKV
ncbi:hypothetical protein E1301_Tti000676 [Triplophysa tibetana]|uniref:Uncharacterized protein n=1 Tax=Triplophysa tibetana TaxID=1572043 RepID=A0A5A9N555_9TELE|nr:hypothetical protein E1301_Tti000676 [Triplophysa tibetana]